MSNSSPAYAAVDWGTSRLRIWLVDGEGNAGAPRRADEGMEVARENGFEAVLEAHLRALGATPTLPAIVCGMAGARQGWIEAPYGETPAQLDVLFASAIRTPGERRPVWIVPGICQRDAEAPDVMRGEETQLAGALSLLRRDGGSFCLPGTHSKWVRVEERSVVEFRTAMTGELFALLSGRSILRHAVGDPPAAFPAEHPDFAGAVVAACADPARAMSRLFSVRAGSLLFDADPASAAAYLSGLLIGIEIAAAPPAGSEPVCLVASGLQGALYSRALEAAGIRHRTLDAEACTLAGLGAAAGAILTPGVAGMADATGRMVRDG